MDWWLKKWGRDAVVDGNEPLTREDVERLIEANGGTAEDLDLTSRNMSAIRLDRANLQGADFSEANFQGAFLSRAKLQGADLRRANLQGASLREANLREATLAEVTISPDTNLEGVEWDPKYISALERRGQYEPASAVYRRLKEWYRGAGMLTIAGEFHHREREASRKAGWQRSGRQFKTELAAAWRRFRGKAPGGAPEG